MSTQPNHQLPLLLDNDHHHSINSGGGGNSGGNVSMGNIIGGVGNNNLGFGSLQPFEVPDAFGMVEDGIYRSSVPKAEKQFQYLKTLNLKTILFLSQEIILKSFTSFLEEEKIDLIELGLLISNRTLSGGLKMSSNLRSDQPLSHSASSSSFGGMLYQITLIIL